MDIENGRIIFGYMAMMLEDRTPWDPQTVYHHNRCKMDENGNWWVSKKSTKDAPNINHPFPGFDQNGDPLPSEWWALWIDWQHPMSRLEAAVSDAIAAAGNAAEKAEEARQAAEEASGVDVSDHEHRISLIETALGSVTHGDVEGLISDVAALQALIGADVDGVINKFNEFVAFLAGISDLATLQGIIADFTSQLAGKQPAGDYATNTRVDGLESKVNRLVTPRFDGDMLVFPAESTAYFDDDVLVLTQ